VSVPLGLNIEPPFSRYSTDPPLLKPITELTIDLIILAVTLFAALSAPVSVLLGPISLSTPCVISLISGGLTASCIACAALCKLVAALLNSVAVPSKGVKLHF
jgi:hypothetical protein